MILVTGATGNFGTATIDFLLKKGVSSSNIVALVRDEEKAVDLKSKGVNLYIGDYDSHRQLVDALAGVEKLLLVSGSDIANRENQHKNVINAAKEVGINHLFYTSFERKNETETSPIRFIAASHIATENYIKSSGLNYTIFRNNLYLDLLPLFLGDNVLETGVFLPAGETKSALTLRADMAEATANVLITDGHENKEYSFSNSENISIREVAKVLGNIVGKEIAYINPTRDAYIKALTDASVPAEYIGMIASFSEAIKQGEFEVQKTDLEKILGRKPTSVEQYLTQVYASAKIV